MQCVVLKRIDENLYPTHWRQTCALMGLHHEVRQLISNIIQKLIKLKKHQVHHSLILSQVWNKQWIDKLIIGRWFHEKGHWYAEKCHDLSRVRQILQKDWLWNRSDKILILIHLLAVSHTPCWSVLDFWKIDLEKSSSTNWIFSLFRIEFLLPE